MHSSNHTEHYKKNCIISHAQNATALQPNIFLTPIYERMAVGFPLRKPLPRSPANSTVNISTFVVTFVVQTTTKDLCFAVDCSATEEAYPGDGASGLRSRFE